MLPESLENLFATGRNATLAAANILSGAYRQAPGIQGTSGKDIKTDADLAAEIAIRQVLAPTAIPILGEESGLQGEEQQNGLLWVVDPLDGTFNYVRGLPFCGVSIALWQGSNPLLGLLYDLTDQSLLSGIVGQGAWREKEPIHVSTVAEPGQAALATGFPNNRDYGAESLHHTIRSIQRFKKIRMLGSAALSLGQVAMGKLDAYWEEDIWFWDVAAGLALVQAAGGTFRMTPGSTPRQFHIYAHNSHLTNF